MIYCRVTAHLYHPLGRLLCDVVDKLPDTSAIFLPAIRTRRANLPRAGDVTQAVVIYTECGMHCFRQEQRHQGIGE